MKPTITKQKDARGRIRSHVATFGPISFSSAVSASDAIASCERETVDALERLDRGAVIGQWNGHTYVVSPDAHGWRTWCDAFSRTDYYVGMHGTREDAEDSILSHLASCVWSHDITDDRAFVATLPERLRADLVKRFAWYRAMRAFVALGYTDDQARQMIADGIMPAPASSTAPAPSTVDQCTRCGGTDGPIILPGSADAACPQCGEDWPAPSVA